MVKTFNYWPQNGQSKLDMSKIISQIPSLFSQQQSREKFGERPIPIQPFVPRKPRKSLDSNDNFVELNCQKLSEKNVSHYFHTKS